MTFATYPSLAGRVAFISGGATGIGSEIVRAFVRNDCRVAFVDIDDKAGRRLATELNDGGGQVVFIRTDVTDIEALRQSIAQTRARLGPVAVLVNNAANDERHAVAAVDVDYWDRAQNVNLRHHFFAAQAVHPHMRELGYGSIINLASIAWRRGGGEFAAYATAKAGIVGLTRALARAFGPDNIRVNAIEPGAVMTERQQLLWYRSQAAVDEIVQRQSLKRTLLGEEIARAALFLAADDSRMITKQTLTVDAGLR
ncbi:SDR family oxidoreductase [Vineibacter terrae]|uniref:SDR family NAD(P)-dependent oxidoreductase n=1 Tax=Vineibacter terrae TaxID=2586908 RepID=UPI002E368A6C|nr:SDR family oxidoreductase [Vineibacter terrae]HEX2891419.1 SDR family oxidoreductase [Vineibacter terrae]